jgi:hypothetical protein
MSIDTSNRAPAPLHSDIEPDSRRVLDPADADTAETVIYRCGTLAPGAVHEPCQHSVLYVLCCTCAGCPNDVWACGKKPVADSWLWYEAHSLGEKWDPWVRHPAALVLYALVIVFMLASGMIQSLFEIFTIFSVLVSAAVILGLLQILR